MDLITVDEETLDWLNFHKSPMSMAEMETNRELGCAEFRVLADCGLTLKQFHVVLLYYFCELKQREISKIMRMNQSNVSRYLSQSRKKILKKLTKT